MWRHYGLEYGASYSGQQADCTGQETDDQPTGRTVAGTNAGGYNRDDPLGEGAAGRHRAPGTGRVRPRRYVTTEEQQVNVPVRHEKVRLEHEPPGGANADAATSDPKATDAEHEVILHEEQPVVDKQVVPKERVRLDKETVTDQQLAEEIRKEQIDVEDHSGPDRRP